MQLMVEANFISVFIGIESPNEASLRETKKFQNVRAGGTLLEQVHRIQDAGLEVWCGMIVGFDHDDATIFDAQREFLARRGSRTPWSACCTPSPRRRCTTGWPRKAGSTPPTVPEFGTNVIPLQMTREELRDGYVQALMTSCTSPRPSSTGCDGPLPAADIQYGRAGRWWRRHPWSRAQGPGRQPGPRRRALRPADAANPRPPCAASTAGGSPGLLRAAATPPCCCMYLIKCAMHYHHVTLAADMARRRGAVVNSI